MMAGPVGSGLPNQYPLAVNTPLDRAYLRPLQEPLYDTETLAVSSSAASLTFFQRPIGQSDASGLVSSKDFSETNINQSSMLDYPREFSILGFNIVLDSTIGLSQIAIMFRRAYFQFVFSGRRPYLTVPLHRLPQGVGIEGGISQTQTTATMAFGKWGMGHVANYYKFNLGRAALKIKPGEAFNAKITWPVAVSLAAANNQNFNGTAASPAGFYVCTSVIGLQWSPL